MIAATTLLAILPVAVVFDGVDLFPPLSINANVPLGGIPAKGIDSTSVTESGVSFPVTLLLVSEDELGSAAL